MAEISQMGDADIIDLENKYRVLAALHAAAFIVIGGNDMDRNVTDRRRDFFPVFTTRCEPVQYDRGARRHVDAVVRTVLMAGGDDMLRQARLRQIVSSMG